MPAASAAPAGQAAQQGVTPAGKPGTAPLPAPGTAPLPRPSTAPLPGTFGPTVQVPPALVHALVQRIQAGFPQNVSLEKTPEIEQMLAGRFMAALSQVPGPIPHGGQEALFRAVTDEILGLGPLEPLIKDESISEIMVNGPEQVWVERKGHLVESGVVFQNEEHVMRIAQRIVAPLGRRIDRKWPM